MKEEKLSSQFCLLRKNTEVQESGLAGIQEPTRILHRWKRMSTILGKAAVPFCNS